MEEPEDLVVASQLRWALDYLIVHYDESALKKKRDSLSILLKEWIIDNCEQDENGNYLFYFPKPYDIDGKTVRGLIAQRRVSEFVNEDRAFDIALKNGVLEECSEEVVTTELNLDKLYAFNQQGVIPDDEIDSIIELKESYALIQMKE